MKNAAVGMKAETSQLLSSSVSSGDGGDRHWGNISPGTVTVPWLYLKKEKNRNVVQYQVK